MKVDQPKVPRVFEVGGRRSPIRLKDCARIELSPDEQVTFVTESGAEYDVARKSWGFYATPSLNARLVQQKLRAVLVRNPEGRFYVWLVERGKEAAFEAYLKEETHVVVRWLDNDHDLEAVGKGV
jgi:hypothetical protein